jgi:hypothetical protein
VLVFKRSSVYRLSYTGSNTYKWRVELIATGMGAWSKHDVVNCGDTVVFSGPGGAWRFDGASFRPITDYVGELGPSRASCFLPIAQNVVFIANTFGSTHFVVAYNLVSDAWGSKFSQFVSTTALLSTNTSAYTLMTGEPAALRTFVGIATQGWDKTMLVQLSANPSVLTDTLLWGFGPSGTSTRAALTGSIEGRGGRTLTHFSDLMVDWTESVDSGSAAPVEGEMSAVISYADSQDLFVTPSSVTVAASSGTQRRFDFQVTAPYARPTILIEADEGYVEVNDYSMKMVPAGEL